MYIKKYMLFCLAVIMLFLFTSCSGNDETTPAESESGNEVTATVSVPTEEMPILDFEPSMFSSEKEFTDAILSGKYKGDYSLEGITYYFKPSVIPVGASLKEVRVKDVYISLVYQLDDKPDNWDNYFKITWYRTMKPGDLAKDRENW